MPQRTIERAQNFRITRQSISEQNSVTSPFYECSEIFSEITKLSHFECIQHDKLVRSAHKDVEIYHPQYIAAGNFVLCDGPTYDEHDSP